MSGDGACWVDATLRELAHEAPTRSSCDFEQSLRRDAEPDQALTRIEAPLTEALALDVVT